MLFVSPLLVFAFYRLTQVGQVEFSPAPPTIVGGMSPGWFIQFTPDGRQLLTNVRAASLWDAQSLALLSSFKFVPRFFPRDAAISNDGATYAFAGDEGAYLVASGSPQAVKKLEWHGERLWKVAVSQDGSLVASGGGRSNTPQSDGIICIWDLKSKKLLKRISDGINGNMFTGLAFSHDSSMLVGCVVSPNYIGGRVQVFNVQTGKFIRHLDGALNNPFCFSPDGKYLALCNFRPGVQILNAKNFSIIASWPLRGSGGRDMKFFPDSSRLAIAGSHQTQVRDAFTGRLIEKFIARNDLPNSHGQVGGAGVNWNPFAKKQLGIQDVPEATSTAVSVSPDGHTLATLYAGGSIMLWPVK